MSKNEINKTGLKRLFLTQYSRIITWVLLSLPALYLYAKRAADDMLYQNAIPIIAFVIPFLLANGYGYKINNKTTVRYRRKYRYLFWILSNILCCAIMSLLDYYYFGKDYFYEIIKVVLCYSLICSPVVFVRTYYSRELDLLDYIYRNYEEHILRYIVLIVVGFYAVMFTLMWLSEQFNFKYLFHSSRENEHWIFISITMIEVIIYYIIYYIYYAYMNKKKRYIFYR
ncbi:hypothetical protein F7D95_06595 [Prevotella copri]|uniref:Uncharacterized protein n=1 Tax=Segatella copri TaxID=165179 RepID=A0AA90UEV1_9BACT|nr:hypothetical protein [Segatella copri]MQN12492.1 hypothetical protein [Segatella copri]